MKGYYHPFHFLALLCICTIVMNYVCVRPCKSSFSNRAGLTRHQNGCTIFATAQALKLEQRRVVAAKTSAREPLLNPRTRTSASTSTVVRPRSSRPKLPHVDAPAPPNPIPQDMPLKTTKSGRVTRIPSRFNDELPVNPMPIPIETTTPPIVRRVILHVRDFFRSAVNKFNVLREYHHRPSYDPDSHIRPEDLANFPSGPTSKAPTSKSTADNPSHSPPWPFNSMSKYLIMHWFHSGGNQKSEGEIDRLINEVITAPGFNPGDLTNFKIWQGNQTLDKTLAEGHNDGTPFSSDGWREVTVDIEIPVPVRGAIPKIFHIPGFYHRSITSVIKETWASITSYQFHLAPFKRIHVNPSTGEETRIYDEVYTSDTWIEAHDRLQKQPNEPGCKLEKVIAGLMFWSDSTHLTNFGTASVWPLYLYFANLSKYVRAQPSSGACHHIAYIPYVSFMHMLQLI